MGKKHKKHKSEKNLYDDRPLKLVLKVAGNEVTTGSAILEPVHDDLVDSDKHKDKKKKKKKKDEKDKESPPGSPGEDRKRKMTKKRKGHDSVDLDWDEQSRTPARSDVSQDKPLTPSLAKLEEKEQTPLQEALSQLIRQLQ
ncbi:bromodomain-containing protein 7 isoform X1, partial [Tachysurus ichikawai]